MPRSYNQWVVIRTDNETWDDTCVSSHLEYKEAAERACAEDVVEYKKNKPTPATHRVVTLEDAHERTGMTRYAITQLGGGDGEESDARTPQQGRP